MARYRVFISYSRKDATWRDKLLSHLTVLESENLLHLWVDEKINAGEQWLQEIQSAMDDSSVAILLVSADFLSSQFIKNEEIPRLLKRHSDDGMLVIPLIIRPCAWKLVKWLRQIQARPRNGLPLSVGDENTIDTELADFSYEVAELLERFSSRSPMVRVANEELDRLCHQIEVDGRPVTDSAINSILKHAIERGAPRYDHGSPIDCAQIYDFAARRLLDLMSVSRRSGDMSKSIVQMRAVLDAAIPEKDSITIQNANKIAWQLRDAFDLILGMV